MAYFANGSEGELFYEQCTRCRFGEEACPIFEAQVSFNYEAVGNKIATNILNVLVHDDGTCEMFKRFENTLKQGL